jgi:acetyl esterase/lipase
VDERGHNSVNWPGLTLTYRWLTRFSSLRAYSLTRPLPGQVGGIAVAPPGDWWERANAAFLRGFLRTCFKPLIGPPAGPRMQRRVVSLLAPLMPGVGGVGRTRVTEAGLTVEVLAPERGDSAGVILYLHGGAFCLGAARTHRSITTRLAVESGLPVWVPEYRLAPEHPYPAALDDALACYERLLADGFAPRQLVLAGDSAGGSLALALALRLRDSGRELPAGLMMMSPVADAALSGPSVAANAGLDPMIRRDWVAQGIAWYACPAGVEAHQPLSTDLSGLPPMLVQAGDREILLSDSLMLAEHARKCGVDCRLEVHEERWHVFHLQAAYLASARAALRAMALFARERLVAPVAPAAPGEPAARPARRDEAYVD